MAGDPDLSAAQTGPVATPSGMTLNGQTDTIKQPPGEEGDLGTVEQRTALVDFLEFYLLHYFKAQQESLVERHAAVAGSCRTSAARHVTFRICPIKRDRRVADVETVFDAERGNFNRLFPTASLLLANPSSIGQQRVAKTPAFQPFLVRNIFTDLKRHDLGPNFHERSYDGTMRSHEPPLRSSLTISAWARVVSA